MAEDAACAPHALDQPPTHAARDLTRGGDQAWIVHDGKLYVLRITRAGKLILTK